MKTVAFVALAALVVALASFALGYLVTLVGPGRVEKKTRYLCTVDAEVIAAVCEEDARDRMREMMRAGAVVVNVVEIEGEQE